MTSTPGIRLLVLSDLHAHTDEPDPGGATSLSFHGSAEGVAKLFDGLVQTLRQAGITSVDAVVCPGDLTNCCDTTALARVWERLCALADALDAELVATAGNHDHDSRGLHGVEPKQFLMALRPPFPVRDEGQHAKYFAYDFARIEVSGHTLVSLNSAALAGLQGPEGDESRHGRVTARMVKSLSEELAARPAEGTRVLVVHHHPVQLPAIDLNERSRIIDTELLLEALANDGPWLVIHGHKHRPWIQYAPGGGGSAVLFSAGSFAAPLDGVLAQSTKNQFYVIDVLAESEGHALGLGPAGRFNAWTHSPLEPEGWIPSGRNDGLPAAGGFGWREDPSRLSRRVLDRIADLGTDLTWDQLVSWDARLPYLNPDDWTKCQRQLERTSANVKLVWDRDGCLERIAWLQSVAP